MCCHSLLLQSTRREGEGWNENSFSVNGHFRNKYGDNEANSFSKKLKTVEVKWVTREKKKPRRAVTGLSECTQHARVEALSLYADPNRGVV